MTENELKNKVDQLFERWNKKGSPGCAIGVIKDGEFLYKNGYGMANLDYDIPITPQTVFRIASVSKQFTAFSIMLLVKEGKILLDDDIRKYLPEMPEYEKTITIRHLIHHTSGIRDCYELYYLKGYDDFGMDFLTNEIILGILSKQDALNFLPGEGCSYSNSGYILLTIIIKRITGQTLREFTEENIFKPLGMKNTHFQDDRTEIIQNRATAYSQSFDKSFKINETNMHIIGDGGLLTTIDDFLFWERNFYNPIVGDEEIFAQTIIPGRLNNGDFAQEFGSNYAFGLFIGEYRGLKTIAHGGAWVGFRSFILRFPDHKFSVICFSNFTQFLRIELSRRIADIYLKNEFPKRELETVESTCTLPTIELHESELKKFKGFYHDDKNGDLIDIRIQNGNLHAFVIGIPSSLKLEPIEKNKFKFTSGLYPTIFEFRQSSDTGDYNIVRFLPEPFGKQHFKKIIKLEFSKSQLEEYENNYYSKEIESHHTFKIVENQLNLAINNNSSLPIFLVKKDHFWDAIRRFSIIFQRNHKENITGFIVSTWLAKGVQFKRI